MKINSLYITKNYIFITTNSVQKNVYIQKMTEASRKRLNNLLRSGKVRTYICDIGTIAISRV